MKKSNEIWLKIFSSYDGIRKSQVKLLSNFKLTAPQFGVMEVLHVRGEMPLKKISQELLVTGANITCVVDNLEKENLVERIHSKKDRRVIKASLTEKGKQKMDSMFPQYMSSLDNTMKNLSDVEKGQLINLLDKLSPSN